jgi:hypothetical protein
MFNTNSFIGLRKYAVFNRIMSCIDCKYYFYCIWQKIMGYCTQFTNNKETCEYNLEDGMGEDGRNDDDLEYILIDN